MYKIAIKNEINGKEYSNVVFNKNTLVESNTRKCINLIYASNGVGKSTTSKIIYANYNQDIKVVNKFNNNAISYIDIKQDDYNIDKCFRYDREFTINSVSMYKGQLIVSPNSATELSKTQEDIDAKLSKLLNNYKQTDIYKEQLLVQFKEIFKGSRLEKFSLKTVNKGHSEAIFNELFGVIDDEIVCPNLTIVEYVDFGFLFDDRLINELNKVEELINEQVEINFPEVNPTDYEVYKIIYEYLKNNNLNGKKCLMCGQTIFDENLMKIRIATIQQIITEYSNSEKGNEFLESINEFLAKEFNSQTFKDLQMIAKTISHENIVDKTLAMLEIFSQFNIKDIKKNYENCLLKKIVDEIDSDSLIKDIDKLKLDLNNLIKKNKSRINEHVKQIFVDNLEKLGFKYFPLTTVEIDEKTHSLIMNISEVDIEVLYREVLSESEKTLLSLSLFLAISTWNDQTLIIIDDPVDSHDEKTKWFIMNQIFENFNNSNVLLLIFTHDLSLSKTISSVSNIIQKCFVMHEDSIDEIESPSLYFENIYDYIYNVEQKISTLPQNAKYFLPLTFMMRYLSKNQKKLYEEFIASPPLGSVTRKYVKNIGFNEISEYFVHYNPNIDSLQLFNDICLFMPMNYSDTTLPSYFKSSISTDDLIESIMVDIGNAEQYQAEITKILSVLLIRNILEKKLLRGIPRLPREQLGKIAENYKNSIGIDALYHYYVRNKTLVDDFAHIESGPDILLTYSIKEIQDKYNELLSL